MGFYYPLETFQSCEISLAAIQCDRLSDIRNGRVDLTGTSVGSTATYSCNQGFALIGGATRTCQSNGEWSGEEPFCGRIRKHTI